MKKISLFPFLLLCLVAGFALIAMADESLFEDINMSGYLKQGAGVTFSPAATTGTSTNNAVIQIHAATTGLWNSASSVGFYRFGRLGIQESVGNVLMGDTNIMNTTIQSYTIMFPKAITDLTEIRGQVGAELKLSVAADRAAGFTTNTFTIGISGTEWITANKGHNLIQINGRNGPVDNSLLITNFGSFVNMGNMTSSNFQQTASSAGGFVGNGSGLTNLPGSGVGGFTAGSSIFAGSTGALSQDNANYFWDITNRRLGIGLNSGLLAKVHVVATNGVVFTYMGDSYSTTTNPEDASGFIGRRARGTVAAPTAVQSGDVLSIFTGRGYGATGFSSLGRSKIQMEASETWTDTAQGSRIVFYTTPSTTTNTVEAMRIHNDGAVGIGTNTIVSATKLYVNGSIGAATSIYAGGSPLISATNTFIGVSVGGVTGDLSATYVTNALADFPSILAASFADISYPVPSSIITNMVVNLGNPSTENGSLAVNGYVSSNGFVTIRARNIGAVAVDQGNLPYRISVDKIPTLNTLP